MSAPEKRPGFDLGGISRRFAGDFGFKVLTELLSAVLGLYVFALLTHMFGKSGDYAVLNQMIAMSTLVVPLLLMRMNTALCVFLPGDKDQSRVRSRFVFVMLIALALGIWLCVAAWLLAEPLTGLLWDDGSYADMLPVMTGYFAVMALTTLCQSFLQATGHQKKANTFQLLRVLSLAVAFTGMVLASASATWNGAEVLRKCMWIYFTVECAVFLLVFAVLLWDWRGVKISLAIDAVKPLYAYALPLLPVTVMAWINSYIGRFLLNHLIADELRSASIYGFYDALTSRAFFINAVLVYTVFPYIAKAWNRHDRGAVIAYLHKSFNIGAFAAVPITLGLVLICPTVVDWMAGGNYPVDRTLLFVLCLAQTFQMLYMNYSYLIDLSRKSRWFNGIFLLSSGVNVISCLLLIPRFGVLGSAIGLAVAYGLQLAVAAGIGHTLAGISVVPDMVHALKAIASGCIMYVVCHFLYLRGQAVPYGGVWNAVLTVIVGVAVYLGCQWLLSKLTKTKII